MAVETNETAKNWLATNAGVGNCFATSGVSYFTVEGDPKTGGTFIVLTFLQTAGLLDATKNNVIVNGKSYNDYLSETGETGIADADDELFIEFRLTCIKEKTSMAKIIRECIKNHVIANKRTQIIS
ncbi:unnamed protein product [marine sediment metagenome]|uniref:Uncharacterized protein n=1 Tax=marine sediment metagenome TaxID=412755 RepID=X1DY85_9ZZZZ